MSELVYDLNCNRCGGDYTLRYVEDLTDNDEPLYCPFCGADVDLSDVEDMNAEEYIDELDFDD